METNWYIEFNGQSQGPYTWSEIYNMTSTGHIVASTKIYHEQLGGWVEACGVSELGLKPSIQYHTNQQASPPTQNIKKHGCLKGCLGFVAIGVIGLILVLTFLGSGSKNDRMQLSKEKIVSETMIEVGGGTIVVDSPNSEIDGLTIDVPESSYGSSKAFEISTKEIKNHDWVLQCTYLIVLSAAL